MLHEMIAQKPESASLREYGRVVIDRTILKAKNQTAGDPVTLCYLSHLTIRKALAVKGTQCQKAMHQAFHVAHGDLIGRQQHRVESRGAGQWGREQPKPETS
jgi:hypothetical protein